MTVEPAFRGFARLPALPAVPSVDIGSNAVLLQAVTFLNLAFELITLAGDLIKIVVSEFPPLLLDLALDLFQFPSTRFQSIRFLLS